MNYQIKYLSIFSLTGIIVGASVNTIKLRPVALMKRSGIKVYL